MHYHAAKIDGRTLDGELDAPEVAALSRYRDAVPVQSIRNLPLP